MKEGEETRLVVLEGGIPQTKNQAKNCSRSYKEVVLGTAAPKRPPNLSVVLSELSRITSTSDSPLHVRFREFFLLALDYLELDSAVLATLTKAKQLEVIVTAERFGSPVFSAGSIISPVSLYFKETLAQQEPFEADKPNLKSPLSPYCESYLGCSLRNGQVSSGLIAFFSRERRSKPFSEEQKAISKLIASYAANELAKLSIRATLRHKRDFEQLITSISTQFLNRKLDEIDTGIISALEQIALFAGVELSYIFQLKDDNSRMDITHWWTADGSYPQFRTKNVPVAKYPWLMGQILRREVAEFLDPELLPEEASAEKQFAERQGIKSAILVPMAYSSACVGLVGFASKIPGVCFDSDTITLLRTVGHILATAVEYKRSQEALRSLERQMLHTQKLDSLGLLAGGIAHDFNNLLMAILGNASLALGQLRAESRAIEYISRIEKITLQASSLAGKLLSYSGQAAFSSKSINLSSLLENMPKLLESMIDKKHRLKFNLLADLPAIEGDPAQLEQVVINLVKNSSEAIGNGNGTISISTGLVAVDRKYLMGTYLSKGAKEGVYAYLQVKDNGCGIDRDTISLICDPFFTTKVGGHGLGLAATLGIVRAHGGTLDIKSEVGSGSTFTLLFPCSKNQNTSLISKKAKKTRKPISPASVLLVDDEPTVREAVATILKQGRFTVATAENGRTAVQWFIDHAGEIDVAVVDLNMPDIDGAEVINELRKLRPELPVVLTSGYTENEARNRARYLCPLHFLQKPYEPDTLLQLLSEIAIQAKSTGARA